MALSLAFPLCLVGDLDVARREDGGGESERDGREVKEVKMMVKTGIVLDMEDKEK